MRFFFYTIIQLWEWLDKKEYQGIPTEDLLTIMSVANTVTSKREI